MEERRPGSDAAEERRAQRKAQRAERQLHAHFSGRREARRVESLAECRVSGGKGVYRGLAVDLSRAGALICIHDPRFLGDEWSEDGLIRFSFHVGAHFSEGMEIAFLGGALPVMADVVRVTTRVEEETQARSYLVGVSFRRKLGPAECRSLGIPDEDDAPLSDYMRE